MEHRYQRGQQRNGYGEVVLEWDEPTDPLLDETRLHDLHVVIPPPDAPEWRTVAAPEAEQ